MIEEIQKTIAESKDEIRQKYRAEVKGIFGSYARGITTRTAIWTSWWISMRVPSCWMRSSSSNSWRANWGIGWICYHAVYSSGSFATRS